SGGRRHSARVAAFSGDSAWLAPVVRARAAIVPGRGAESATSPLGRDRAARRAAELYRLGDGCGRAGHRLLQAFEDREKPVDADDREKPQHGGCRDDEADLPAARGRPLVRADELMQAGRVTERCLAHVHDEDRVSLISAGNEELPQLIRIADVYLYRC